MPAAPPNRRIDVAAISTPWNTIGQELFRADGLTFTASSDTVTAATPNQAQSALGNGYIDVSAVQNGLLLVNVTAVSGTTPTLVFAFDVQDAYGNWYQVSPSGAGGITGAAAISAAGQYVGNISSGPILPLNGRIRWTLGGTTPNFKLSLNLYGR